jgi:hypothetical protein
MRGPVWVVLETLDFGRNAVLVVTPEIDQTVMLLVAAPAVTRGDMAVIVAPGGAVLAFEQRGKRRTLVQVRRDYFDDRTPPSRSWFDLNDRHLISPP